MKVVAPTLTSAMVIVPWTLVPGEVQETVFPPACSPPPDESEKFVNPEAFTPLASNVMYRTTVRKKLVTPLLLGTIIWFIETVMSFGVVPKPWVMTESLFCKLVVKAIEVTSGIVPVEVAKLFPEDDMVIAPVELERAILEPAVKDVTPVFETTTAPVVGVTKIPEPEPVTEETALEVVAEISTTPVPPEGLRVMFDPAVSWDTPATTALVVKSSFGESMPL